MPTTMLGLRARAGQTLAVTACLTVFMTTAIETASADEPYTVGYTAGLGAYPRSSPQYEARTGTAVPEGTLVDPGCWSRGGAITNPDGYTSDIWVLDSAGRYWWSEAWLETGSYGIPDGLPECGTAPVGDTVTEPQGLVYDRNAAVNWARAHAMDIPPQYGTVPSCTWFVSQALWAGGLPQDPTWNATDTRANSRGTDGTLTAWSARDLSDYLLTTYDTEYVQMDFTANAVPEAVIGDVVAYDWESDGTIDHLAFVTGIADGQYPEVSEWGVGTWFSGSGPAGYTSRGWTYSDNHGRWLQADHPQVSASLIHFRGGSLLPTF
ncbi:MAG TPA: amidase domain-containing protein [Actinomycetota bacterium]|nr:amidase domain-containing protein [Actinomycetota bacterium]